MPLRVYTACERFMCRSLIMSGLTAAHLVRQIDKISLRSPAPEQGQGGRRADVAEPGELRRKDDTTAAQEGQTSPPT